MEYNWQYKDLGISFKSRLEKRVYMILKELYPNFNIKTQLHLKDIVKTKVPALLRRLTVDFYIPEFNLCIEVDGEHHFEKVSYDDPDKAQVAFEKRKKLDNMKDNFLFDNNIPLLRISYIELRNLTDEELKTYISTQINNLLAEFGGGTIDHSEY